MENLLHNKEFLKRIDTLKLKEIFTKIIVLNFDDETPIYELQCRVSGGSVSINGNSSLRRTASLTVLFDDYQKDFGKMSSLLSINKKIKLEQGIKNPYFGNNKESDEVKETEIIWYPLGVYLIVGSSFSFSTTGLTANLQLQDKMCLLNGRCGGVIPASTTFHEMEDVVVFTNSTTGETEEKWTTKPILIYDIINELVHHFGGEQLGKIIISDIPETARRLLQWSGDTNLYRGVKIVDGKIIAPDNGEYEILTTNREYNHDGVKAYTGESEEHYSPFRYGQGVGYDITEFTYPGELIADAGNKVTDMLDKIVSALGGNYEYFYDLDGNFRFQEKRNYLNTSLSTYKLEDLNSGIYDLDMTISTSEYNFDNSMVVSYSSTPDYENIKNDYIVWGIRENKDGINIPIRYHLAIDKKPKPSGATYNYYVFHDDDEVKIGCSPKYVNVKIDKLPDVGDSDRLYFSSGDAKMYRWSDRESKYVPLQEEHGTEDLEVGKYKKITVSDTDLDWRMILYLNGLLDEPNALSQIGSDNSNYSYYFTELKNEWPRIYDVEKNEFISSRKRWDYNYFLDIIEGNPEIEQFSIDNIGKRGQVYSSNDINCIFEPSIPDVILIENSDPEYAAKRELWSGKGYNIIQVDPGVYSGMSTGKANNSAYDEVLGLIYQNMNMNTSISVSCIPIYHLEPNTRVNIDCPELGLAGDYIINSLNIQLGVSGTMSMNCTKAFKKM